MDLLTRKHLDNLQSNDANMRYESFQYIINLTHQPVDWAYDVWDDLLLLLHTKDNHQRAIAAQMLSNLAKSDPEKRMLKDLDKIMVVTKDEKFVTARHSLQSLWKIAVADKPLQQMVIDRLAKRYKDCIKEKNCTVIRYDIIEVFRKIYDEVSDEKVKEKALELIETEEDIKYRKKYKGLWKDVIRAEKK
jgi:hypothetical protein